MVRPPLGACGPSFAVGLLLRGVVALRRAGGEARLGPSADAGNISEYVNLGPRREPSNETGQRSRRNNTAFPPIKHRRGDPQVHLLRIQKTAGTVFGERIMRRLCGGESKFCQYIFHSEWQAVTRRGLFNGTVVTFLRHPVERTISEFLFLRTQEGEALARQPQWDFGGDRSAGVLRGVQAWAEPSVERALWAFLEGLPGTPARNRQALYLLGWDREGGETAWGKYDWEGNHSGLLEEAKAHLRTTLFGITDCFEASAEVITQRLGWNTTEALLMAGAAVNRKPNMKQQAKRSRNLSRTLLAEVLNQSLAVPVSAAWTHSRPEGTWRSHLPPKLVNYIENWNAVDMELYEYALKLFEERYNRTCQ